MFRSKGKRVNPHGSQLAEEAAGVLMQAESFARRRRHAQVTPLHVAGVLFSTSGAACLKSHSSPVQREALELCFGAALGRLRTTDGSNSPNVSNALVAAIKRAKVANSRRGSTGAKVTIDGLVLSILDDPGVTSAMRAAGFSSLQLKADVEKAVSPDRPAMPAGSECSKAKAGDAMHLLDCMASEKKRCMDVAGENTATTEAMAKVGEGDFQLQQQHSEGQSRQARPITGWPTFIDAAAGNRSSTHYQVPVVARETGGSMDLRLHVYTNQMLELHQKPNQRHDHPNIATFYDCPLPASYRPKFTELTAQNLKILCNTLELHVPSYKDITPEIAITVLRCRSGIMKRMRRPGLATWLLFQGRDAGAKDVIARELGRLVFGSSFTKVNYKSSMHREHNGEKQIASVDVLRLVQRLSQVVSNNPHSLIMIDGINHLGDGSELISIKNTIENGRMDGRDGNEVSLEDAIIVLSSESFGSRTRANCQLVKHTISSNGSSLEASILSIVDGVFFF